MNICLMGASNSFETMPFPQALKNNNKVSKFRNVSVGGSSSLLGVRGVNKAHRDDFDFTILEFVVNENTFLGCGSLSINSLKQTLNFLATSILNTGSTPVFLILPTFNDEEGIVTNFYREYCEDMGFIYFDVYKFMNSLRSKNSELSRDYFFDNPNHISRDFSVLVADHLVDKLHLVNSKSFEGDIATIKSNKIINLSFSELIPNSHLPIHSIANSVINEKLVEISQSHEGSITISLGKNQSIIGYSFDAAQSSGYLVIEGDKKICIDLGTAIYNGNRQNVFFILPIPTAVSSVDEKIKFVVEKSAPFSAELTYSQWKHEPDKYPTLDGIVRLCELYVVQEDQVIHAKYKRLNIELSGFID